MSIMGEVIRNRTIRPSTRQAQSKSYKVDTKHVLLGDILVVHIHHGTKPFSKTYRFNGVDVVHKNSISFRLIEDGATISISWSGAIPIENITKHEHSDMVKPLVLKGAKNEALKPATALATHLKQSFEPISDTDTTILILGSIPGDKSIELGEYYGHSRNRFWKIVATITNNEVPLDYTEKKALLARTKIGLWDVARKANRKGSLDCAIEAEEPNMLDDFIREHKHVNVIGFNGKKSQALYDKYFDREPNIKYFLLPSSSSANASISFDAICKQWARLLDE